jgi:flagellar secretion chaperone FliS
MSRHKTYKSIQINTASKERIMVLLFEGALRHMQQSRAAIARKEPNAFHDGIQRAAQIVIELQSSLKSEVAPQLCDELSQIYGFVVGRLMMAAANSDPRPVVEAERAFSPIADAFAQVAKQQSASQPQP